MITRIEYAWAAVLLASSCGSAPPPGAASPPSHAARALALAPRQSPCVVLATIGSDPAKLVVRAVDVETGATRPRMELPLRVGALSVIGGAIRGDEIALNVRDEEGGELSARIDLAARSFEVGVQPMPIWYMGHGSVLASDGVAYYRACLHDNVSYLCRGKDWEVHGVRTRLEGTGDFDAIAVSGRELYGIGDDLDVRVFDLSSGRETRRVKLAESVGARGGFGIVGDTLVIGRGESVFSLVRFDRETGAARGTARVALPEQVRGVRLACAADPGPSPAR